MCHAVRAGEGTPGLRGSSGRTAARRRSCDVRRRGRETGERVGYLWIAERDNQGRKVVWIYDIEIDERFRGRGLGRATMELAEQQARERGLGRVELNVFGRNEVARSLYRSLGYEESAVWMGKELS